MNSQESIRRILNEESEIPISVIRRASIIDKVINNLLPNMYPCDYNSSDHFVGGVLDEIIWFLVDVEELQGIERMDIENYILDYKYDELTEYFNERCNVLNNDNLQESIRKLLKEETEYGGGIFYHNSDHDIESFIPQIKKGKKSEYLFFSNEPNAFIDRKYTYKVKLEFNPNKIFNTFKHIKEYGIKYTLENYKKDVLNLFKNNTDYFIDEWNRTGVDSVSEVMEYFIDEGGDENDMVGLLWYFITKWNDSWVILETDKFLDFMESKGYDGFVTQEEGLINIACKNFKSIKIISKTNMW